jgi:hypothetical protein
LPIWTLPSGGVYCSCLCHNTTKEPTLEKQEHHSKLKKTRKGNFRSPVYVYFYPMKVTHQRSEPPASVCIVPTGYLYVFYMILRINCNYIPEQHLIIVFFNLEHSVFSCEAGSKFLNIILKKFVLKENVQNGKEYYERSLTVLFVSFYGFNKHNLKA